MINLYFTDWDDNNLPIPNGKIAFANIKNSLIKQGVIIQEEVEYFHRFRIECAAHLSKTSFRFVNVTTDPFLFVIDFDISPPYFELLAPMKEIIPTSIVSEINRNGYLVLLENESWDKWLYEKLLEEAIHLGLSADKVIFITAAKNLPDIDYVFWDWPQESTLYILIDQEKLTGKILKDIHATIKPDKLYTCLNNEANIHKLRLLNSLYRHDLEDKGYLSVIHIKDRIKYAASNQVLSNYPLILDKEDTRVYKFTDAIKYHARSFISIIGPANDTWDHLRDANNVWNNDLYCIAAAKRPFLTNSSKPGKLKAIRDAGYKTFSDYFDESYDDEADPDKRVEKLITTLKYLHTLDTDKLLLNMKPVLEHNFQHFFRSKNRTSHDVINHLTGKLNEY